MVSLMDEVGLCIEEDYFTGVWYYRLECLERHDGWSLYSSCLLYHTLTLGMVEMSRAVNVLGGSFRGTIATAAYYQD